MNSMKDCIQLKKTQLIPFAHTFVAGKELSCQKGIVRIELFRVVSVPTCHGFDTNVIVSTKFYRL